MEMNFLEFLGILFLCVITLIFGIEYLYVMISDIIAARKEYREKVKRFGCKSCELFGNDCDGVSGHCDCAYIIVDHTQKGEKQ